MRDKLFENCEHKIMNPPTRRSDVYEGLAACVILQALKDYVGNEYRASAKQFLLSEHFRLFSDVSGELWMEYAEQYGVRNISMDAIIGTGRKKDWCYGKKGKQGAGTIREANGKPDGKVQCRHAEV